MIQTFSKLKKVKGELVLQGDKSISHRALIFTAMASGKSIIRNLSSGEDVKSTLNILKNLGIDIKIEDNIIVVNGCGHKGFKKYNGELDCGNSGTSARLLMGLLSAQNFESILIGDESLSQRPMQRVIEPLTFMGAKIESNNKKLPLKIFPSSLKKINYELAVASAQVKSALILAALHIDEESQIIDKFYTRDHSERMLNLKTEVLDNKKYISVSKKNYPQNSEYFVPADISSASFFIVLALILKDSELLVKNISLNESRLGYINILKQMGGEIEIVEQIISNNEPYGDLLVRSSKLRNIDIPVEIIPNIIDEIPILAAAGIFAYGAFQIRNAKELRVKESDRIKSLCANFRKLNLLVEEYEDGFRIDGNPSRDKVQFESYSDHRIAMTFSIISLLLNGGEVKDFECVNISNPNFLKQIKNIIN